MFKVLFITFSGIALGYLARKAEWVKFLSKGITWTIWLLLFLFGVQVGSNELVVSNLDTLGLKALLISIAGVLGSSVAAWGITRFKLFSPGVSEKLKSEELPPAELASAELASAELAPAELAPADTHEQKVSNNKIGQFIGGFTVVGFFAVGALAGWAAYAFGLSVESSASIYVLYALMIQVGMSIGSDKKLKEILRSIRPGLLLLPLGTIVGTLLFVALASILVKGIPLTDSLAVGAGFGYYSLSSVLISEIKGATSGADYAAQLGTIALISNIMRELIVLLFSPLLCKIFGRLAPIASGGATSMDSTLPVITAVCGKEMAFISIFHGILVDFSVPFLVTLFASM